MNQLTPTGRPANVGAAASRAGLAGAHAEHTPIVGRSADPAIVEKAYFRGGQVRRLVRGGVQALPSRPLIPSLLSGPEQNLLSTRALPFGGPVVGQRPGVPVVAQRFCHPNCSVKVSLSGLLCAGGVALEAAFLARGGRLVGDGRSNVAAGARLTRGVCWSDDHGAATWP